MKRYVLMAGVWLQTEPPRSHRAPTALPGFDHHEGAWQLRVDYYQEFISDVTGIELTNGLSASELKTIQSRLEGCIETYGREGCCMCEEFSRYEHVDSIATVRELARFFRVLVMSRFENPQAA